jgi:hypothetical protein
MPYIDIDTEVYVSLSDIRYSLSDDEKDELILELTREEMADQREHIQAMIYEVEYQNKHADLSTTEVLELILERMS